MRLADRRGIDTTVYQPAEDSSLLADAAIEDVSGSDLVLDVGTGSGYVGATVAEATDACVIGSDINPHACRRARDRDLDVVRADLVAPFVDRTFDVVVFNPPYLPTLPDAEPTDDWYDIALTGGESGRAVIEPFIDDVGRVLAPEGVVLLLVSTATGVDEVVEYAGRRGFSAAAVEDVPFPGETLTVLKLVQ